MKAKKGYRRAWVLLMLLTTFFLLGFQSVRQEAAAVSGTIEKVEKDQKSLVVNGEAVAITPGTKITDEKGNALKAGELRQSHPVEIEGLRNANGFVATKILVKPAKKKP